MGVRTRQSYFRSGGVFPNRPGRGAVRRAQVSLPRPRPTWAGVEPGKWEKPRGTNSGTCSDLGDPLNNGLGRPRQTVQLGLR